MKYGRAPRKKKDGPVTQPRDQNAGVQPPRVSKKRARDENPGKNEKSNHGADALLRESDFPTLSLIDLSSSADNGSPPNLSLTHTSQLADAAARAHPRLDQARSQSEEHFGVASSKETVEYSRAIVPTPSPMNDANCTRRNPPPFPNSVEIYHRFFLLFDIW